MTSSSSAAPSTHHKELNSRVKIQQQHHVIQSSCVCVCVRSGERGDLATPSHCLRAARNSPVAASARTSHRQLKAEERNSTCAHTLLVYASCFNMQGRASTACSAELKRMSQRILSGWCSLMLKAAEAHLPPCTLAEFGTNCLASNSNEHLIWNRPYPLRDSVYTRKLSLRRACVVHIGLICLSMLS